MEVLPLIGYHTKDHHENAEGRHWTVMKERPLVIGGACDEGSPLVEKGR